MAGSSEKAVGEELRRPSCRANGDVNFLAPTHAGLLSLKRLVVRHADVR
jgi:hypothetical protein